MCLCSFLETHSAVGSGPVKLSENTAGVLVGKYRQGVGEEAWTGDIPAGKGLGTKLST